MATKAGSHSQRIRLFQSERLEKLTVISPKAFVAIWSVVIAGALYAGWGSANLAAAIALVLGGLLIWSLFEYAMHRFIFHPKVRTGWVQAVVFVLHGNHHVHPNDHDRNMMPPIISMWIAGAIWGLFLLAAGPRGSLLFLGFISGYVIYDSFHYACHQFPMRAPVLRQMKRHHMRHHFAKTEGNYAITAIFWDRVFGSRLR